MRMNNLLLSGFLLAGPIACTASSTDVAEPPPDQAFLFEVEYVNWAWGFAWSGFHVDRQGGVWSYTLEAPWPAADQSSFTDQDLLQKYDAGRTRVGTVDPTRLGRMFGLVAAAERGRLTEPVNRCADAGAVAFVAYTYDPGVARYSPILLRQEGDWARENRSAAARDLYEWLRTLVPGTGISGCEP